GAGVSLIRAAAGQRGVSRARWWGRSRAAAGTRARSDPTRPRHRLRHGRSRAARLWRDDRTGWQGAAIGRRVQAMLRDGVGTKMLGRMIFREVSVPTFNPFVSRAALAVALALAACASATAQEINAALKDLAADASREGTLTLTWSGSPLSGLPA